MKAVVPPPVEPGMAVAVVSPSHGALGAWPHRAERAVSYLESLGLRVKEMPNARRNEGWASAPPEARADDLHAAFDDDEVGVVLCSIGGNHANQVVPTLDFDHIAAHQALRFTPAGEWTEEFLDWDLRLDVRPRETRPSTGWRTIRPGSAVGPVIGGCLETICWHLKGTPDWLPLAGSIFFLETSEEAPSPAHVDAYLTDLELLGVFDSCSALVIGRPMGYSKVDVQTLWEIAAARTSRAGIPVLGGYDCGHTDPMVTLPLGLEGHLDTEARTFGVSLPGTA